MKKCYIFLLAFATYSNITAHPSDTIHIDTIKNTNFKNGLLQVPHFYRPFWSDMRSTISRGEFAMATNKSEYDYDLTGKKYRVFLFANLGVNFPLWTGGLKNNKYGLSITAPFNIELWMDLLQPNVHPIINTSYIIGIPEISFIYRFEKPFYIIRNYGFRLSILKHESAHLGDQLTVKRQNWALPIIRVNLSANYSEFSFILNDPDGTIKQNHALKLGLLFLSMDYNSGWYNILHGEADRTLIKPNNYKFHFYVQYQYQTNTNKRTGLQGIFSIELRNRPIYQYPFYSYNSTTNSWIASESTNKTSWSINSFFGVRYNAAIMRYYRLGVGLRVYHGVNPYGQFQNIPQYTQFGLALIME